MTSSVNVADLSPIDEQKRARRTVVLALAHVGLVLVILAGFVYARVHGG